MTGICCCGKKPLIQFPFIIYPSTFLFTKSKTITTRPVHTKDSTKTNDSNIPAHVYQDVKIKDIQFSPLNYRKYISKQDLQSFADELHYHGIISPLTVRPLATGVYELVAGERRLRAATLADMTTVPVVVKKLTDEEVIEIQLAENLQRENPHPLEEAKAIANMQRHGKKIDEIALRLGKSKQFVYTRLTLLSLEEIFHGMFYVHKMTLQEALAIASLNKDSQIDFFETSCNKWHSCKHFKLPDLTYHLNQYKCDLKQAIFNTKDN